MAQLVGQTLNDRFLIKAELGRGGFGTVFVAHDTKLERTVAIKVMLLHQDRAKEEAQMMARVRHPNIVSVLDVVDATVDCYGVSLNTTVIVMDLVEQAKHIDTACEGLPAMDCVAMFRQLLLGVVGLHRDGIVHRDIKPGNALVDAHGTVFLTDLGIALRQVPGAPPMGFGDPVGTPGYISPEQWKAPPQPADYVCDIYSLGVLLLELVAGDRLFPDVHDAAALRDATLNQAPRSLAQRAVRVDGDVQRVIDKALNKTAARRYQTALEFLADVDSLLARQRPRVTPWWMAARWRYIRSWQHRYRVRQVSAALVVLLLMAEVIGRATGYSMVTTYREWAAGRRAARWEGMEIQAFTALAEGRNHQALSLFVDLDCAGATTPQIALGGFLARTAVGQKQAASAFLRAQESVFPSDLATEVTDRLDKDGAPHVVIQSSDAEVVDPPSAARQYLSVWATPIGYRKTPKSDLAAAAGVFLRLGQREHRHPFFAVSGARLAAMAREPSVMTMALRLLQVQFPEGLSSRYYQAVLCHYLGEHRSALHAMEQLTDRGLDEGALTLMKADIMRSLGMVAEADALLSPQLAQESPSFLLLHAAGNVAFDAGDFLRAEGLLERACLLEPDCAEVRAGLGVTLARQRKHASAIAALRTCLTLEPDHADARRNLVHALLQWSQDSEQRGDWQLMKKQVLEAIAVDDKSALAWQFLAKAHEKLKEFPEAIVAYQKCQVLDPNDMTSYVGLISIWGDVYGDAAAVIDQAMGLRRAHPESVHAHVALLKAELFDGHEAAAMRELWKWTRESREQDLLIAARVVAWDRNRTSLPAPTVLEAAAAAGALVTIASRATPAGRQESAILLRAAAVAALQRLQHSETKLLLTGLVKDAANCDLPLHLHEQLKSWLVGMR